MIVFIIPVKSKKVSQQWDKVSLLFERTLKSVCNQTVDNFKVVAVCHERPAITFDHPNLSFVDVHFSPPEWLGNAKTQKDYEAIRLDKSRKLWVGLNYAKGFAPTYIMFVDADDCISNRIAEYVSKYPDENGWLVCSGYEYQDGNDRMFCRNKNFNLRCGSSHIVNYKIISSNLIEFDQITWHYLRHQTINNMFEESNKSLKCLPFKGAVYITENAENIRSQTKYFRQRNSTLFQTIFYHTRQIYKHIFSKKITNQIKEEFKV